MNNQYFGMASFIQAISKSTVSISAHFPCISFPVHLRQGFSNMVQEPGEPRLRNLASIFIFSWNISTSSSISPVSLIYQVMSAFSVVTESCRIPSTLKEKVAGFRTWRFSVRNQPQAVRQTIRIFLRLRITKCPDVPLENILKTGKGGRSINNALHPRLVRAASSTSPSTCSSVPVIP